MRMDNVLCNFLYDMSGKTLNVTLVIIETGLIIEAKTE